MTTESILIAIFVILAFGLVLFGVAAVVIINNLRASRAEQQATRRLIANMDWTTVLSNTQNSSKESVRLLDIIDKRLHKLEALEKLQISNKAEANAGR
jgi:hypothetical protein